MNSERHTTWCLSAVPPPGEGNVARGLSESSTLRRTDLELSQGCPEDFYLLCS